MEMTTAPIADTVFHASVHGIAAPRRILVFLPAIFVMRYKRHREYFWWLPVILALASGAACGNAPLPPASSAPSSDAVHDERRTLPPAAEAVVVAAGFQDILESPAPIDAAPPVTQVIVYKRERYMDLLSGQMRVRRYAIRLGRSPEGAKTRQGDRKTPEGDYRIDWRNPNSSYYKSLHISYPNASDRRQARAHGVDPGGDIMIHGLPNAMNREELRHYIGERDWTDGCIAVSNAAMDELWHLIKDGTPIRILP